MGELTLAETCPPRAALLRYASGGRDPDIAGHISRCDRCACFVSEAMELLTDKLAKTRNNQEFLHNMSSI